MNPMTLYLSHSDIATGLGIDDYDLYRGGYVYNSLLHFYHVRMVKRNETHKFFLFLKLSSLVPYNLNH